MSVHLKHFISGQDYMIKCQYNTFYANSVCCFKFGFCKRAVERCTAGFIMLPYYYRNTYDGALCRQFRGTNIFYFYTIIFVLKYIFLLKDSRPIKLFLFLFYKLYKPIYVVTVLIKNISFSPPNKILTTFPPKQCL